MFEYLGRDERTDGTGVHLDRGVEVTQEADGISALGGLANGAGDRQAGEGEDSGDGETHGDLWGNPGMYE